MTSVGAALTAAPPDKSAPAVVWLFDTDADRGLSEVDAAARLIELGPNGRGGFG